MPYVNASSALLISTHDSVVVVLAAGCEIGTRDPCRLAYATWIGMDSDY